MDPVLPSLLVGAVIAAFVQGLSGFAFGLVAMSLWAWTLEPRLAAVMVVFGSVIGQVVSALSVRRGFQWSTFGPFLAGGLLGIPLGVLTLRHVDPLWFKLLLGLLLVTWAPAMLWSERLPRLASAGRLADGVVGLVGGVMGGLGGFSGSVPTLWCLLRGFDRDLQRNVVQNFNLATLSVTLAIYLASGIVTRDMWPLFALVTPAILLPGLLGTRVYRGLSEAAFRRIVLTLLLCSGIALLAGSVPRLLTR